MVNSRAIPGRACEYFSIMWYAIYTKPGREDSVSLQLRKIGLQVLNPKLRSRKFRQNKLTEIIEPIFPCYIFAYFDKEKYSHLINFTRGVRYIVGKKHPIVVHDAIIHSIKDRMDDDNIVHIEPPEFEKGDRVLIKDGPFKDFQGIFESNLKGSERVAILLDTIHCRLELDSGHLNKV